MPTEARRAGRRVEIVVTLSETGDLQVRESGFGRMRIVAGGGRRLARAAADRVFEILAEEMDAREKSPPSVGESEALQARIERALERAGRGRPASEDAKP